MAKSRRIKRPSKTGATKSGRKLRAASNARELERIEDLLGEDFDSLTDARAALKSESGPAPNKDSYTVRELSSRKNATVKAFLADIENRADEIDKLKRPSDFWAAEIYGRGTYQLFASTSQLVRKLGTYRGLQDENPREALREIKLVRVKGISALKQYEAQKRAELEDAWRINKLKGQRNRKRERQQRKRLESMTEKNKAQAKRIRELEKQLKTRPK